VKNIFSSFLLLFFTWQLSAQSFSNDPETFRQQVLQFLKTTNTQKSLNIGAPFDKSWNEQLNQGQKEKLIAITQGMEEKRFGRANYTLLFEDIIGIPLNQKISAAQFDKILDISLSSIKTLKKQEYTNFQKGLREFINSQNLYQSKFFASKTLNPIYSFTFLGEVPTLSAAEMLANSSALDENGPLETTEPKETLDIDVPPENNDWPSDDEGWDDETEEDWPTSNEDWGNDTEDNWSNDTDNDWDNETDNNPTQINSDPNPAREAVYSSEIDYVALQRAKYQPAVISGPSLHLDQASLMLSSPFDSLKINNVTGNHLFKDGVFAGSSATIDWPKKYQKMEGAQVTLGAFNFRVDRGDFWTPNATLIFPDLFPNDIPGTFKYKAKKSIQQNTKNFPEFTSNESNIKLNFFDGKVQYTGGIQIKGNQLIGTAISKARGELVILDGKGRKAIIKSAKFDFKDSVILAHNGEISIIVNLDSIVHPGIAMRYDRTENRLTVWRENQYDVTPFYDSYHDMLVSSDQLIWPMDHDSIDFKMASGAGLLPATFESSAFFNLNRYQGLNGPYRFHPIGLSVYYAQKYGLTEFNELELSSEYDLDIRLIKGAMKILHTYGFANYNAKTGLVKLLPRAFLYYQAAAKKTDYDNVFISSKMTSGFNASLNLDSMYLNINGIKKFWVTADFKASITPVNGKVSLRENRDIIFDGALALGTFEYKGQNFEFDYTNFIIDLPQIDSIAIRLPSSDGLYSKLQNRITETKGKVYLNEPSNRSGNKVYEKYPYFISDSESTVYFSQPEILDGVYDSSIIFIIAPIEINGFNSDNTANLIFPGIFNSGGIFPNFEDSLLIMEDQSLGFVHNIPKEGYNLYGTSSKTYETITLNNGGLRGTGQIDFLNAHLFSNDFIYYQDSVTTLGYKANIDPGQVGLVDFPQAELDNFRMSWFPRADSMYLTTINDKPFNFYNKSAQLIGALNITQRSVNGSGTLLTRGSSSKSQQMNFKENSFQASNATFEILSEEVGNPELIFLNVKLDFDLQKNSASIKSERQLDAIISFPNTAMETSIPDAVWLLEDSIVIMKKPENFDLEDSYFYSTNPALDSLVFNATNAIYDIKISQLIVQGIPYIQVADAKIIPENNEMTIKINSKIGTFRNAKIIYETPELYHFLTDATVDIVSRNEFNAKATYILPSAKGDTSKIPMYDLSVEERLFTVDTTNEKNRKRNGFARNKNTNEQQVQRYTEATGKTLSGNLEIAPGFVYKGGITLKTYKQALELSGFVQPQFINKPDYDFWITYAQKEEINEVVFDLEEEAFEDGEPLIGGLHQDIRGRLYPTFIEKKKSELDPDYFLAKGMVKYDVNSKNYLIEEPLKLTGEAYEGQTFIYNDSTQTYAFEGEMNFFNIKKNKLQLSASVIGDFNAETSICTLDAALILDVKLENIIADLMALDFLDIIDRLGGDLANELNTENLLKISNLVGDENTKNYQSKSQKDYTPLVEISELLNKFLVISGVKMNWSPDEKAWYNTSKISISNIYATDINTQVDGFLEIKKDDTGGDILNLFIQAAPGSWYYFNYQDNSLLVYTSNFDFNAEIKNNESKGRFKPGQLILVAGEEAETLSYINTFRKVYLDIEAPFKLTYPEGFDEFLDASEDDDDDGF